MSIYIKTDLVIGSDTSIESGIKRQQIVSPSKDQADFCGWPVEYNTFKM